jgi:hypothetical protein
MLSKNDMKAFRGMVTEVVTEVVKEEVTKVINIEVPKMIEANNVLLHEDMQQLIRASEAGMIRRIDESREAILEAIDQIIMPKIEEHDQAIVKLNLAVGIA